MKKFLYTTLAIILFWGTIQGVNTASAAVETIQKGAYSTPYSNNTIQISSLEIVKNPQRFLNRTIVMNATFDKFSTLGLDYKPAMRSSENYIGILIKRDDVIDHTVPLSEMKLFLKRDLAEKNINLESDDKIQITGKVFSTALGDPWIDITEIKVTQKNTKTDKK